MTVGREELQGKCKKTINWKAGELHRLINKIIGLIGDRDCFKIFSFGILHLIVFLLKLSNPWTPPMQNIQSEAK